MRGEGLELEIDELHLFSAQHDGREKDDQITCHSNPLIGLPSLIFPLEGVCSLFHQPFGDNKQSNQQQRHLAAFWGCHPVRIEHVAEVTPCHSHIFGSEEHPTDEHRDEGDVFYRQFVHQYTNAW